MNKQDLAKLFYQQYGRESDHDLEFFFAPGRVCLAGEHIDYNGGLVMPAGISLGIYAVVRKSDVPVVWMRSTLHQSDVIVPLDKPIRYDKKQGWANYPLGVIKYLQDKGVAIEGCEILFHADLPVGAGLSSSAAIEVLTGYIFAGAKSAEDRIALAQLGRQVENDFIGMNCGIMDQFAVAMAKPDAAIVLDCNTLNYHYVPLELGNYSLLILNSMKPHELIESKYNDRVVEANEALAILRNNYEIDTLADATIEQVEATVFDDVLKRRALHVVEEQARVIAAEQALKNGDLTEFGAIMSASHLSLSRQYETSCPEVDELFSLVVGQQYCLGAKITGGGFGGCVIALVKTAHRHPVAEQVLNQYKQRIGLEGEAYFATISGGVCNFGA